MTFSFHHTILFEKSSLDLLIFPLNVKKHKPTDSNSADSGSSGFGTPGIEPGAEVSSITGNINMASIFEYSHSNRLANTNHCAYFRLFVPGNGSWTMKKKCVYSSFRSGNLATIRCWVQLNIVGLIIQVIVVDILYHITFFDLIRWHNPKKCRKLKHPPDKVHCIVALSVNAAMLVVFDKSFFM